MKRERDSEKQQSQWTKGLETLIDKISTNKDNGLQTFIETLEKKWSQEEKTGTGTRNQIRLEWSSHQRSRLG